MQYQSDKLYVVKSDQFVEARLQGHRFLRLLYASPAWWGFTSAADKQRLKNNP